MRSNGAMPVSAQGAKPRLIAIGPIARYPFEPTAPLMRTIAEMFNRNLRGIDGGHARDAG
jgi:hypothetical protein